MKKKHISIFLLPFILIACCCLGIAYYDYTIRDSVYNYTTQYQNKQEIRKEYLQSYQFENDLLRFCYAIDYNNRVDLNVSVDDNIRQIYGEDLSGNMISHIDRFIRTTNNTLDTSYPFLKYKLEDHTDENTIYSNYAKDDLENDDVFIINFDERGNITLDAPYEMEIPIKSAYSNLIRTELQEEESLEPVNLIKNTTFTFAVEKYADLSQLIGYYDEPSYYTDYTDHMNAIMLSFVILLIAGLCLPIKKLSQYTTYQNILNTPLEVAVLVSLGFLSFSARYIVDNFFYNDPLSLMLYGILATIFLFDVLIFKYFLQYPPLLYLKERSLTAQMLSFVFENMKQFDLAEMYNLTVLKGVVVNAIAIIVLPMWFGIVGLIIYCILLFIIIINVANRIRNDYESLLEVTSSIATGKFDKKTDTDLGVFNSYKDSMDTIRDDFKNAIDNELRSEKMKTELITSVSHDLKTPLTSIVTYADLLKDDNLDDEKKKEYIAIIDRSALRLKNLINDLFEVSKASSGNLTLNLMNIDIISLIKQALLENDHLFEKQGLIIKFNTNKEKVILNLDSQKTYRIFTNLIVNISKYAMENTRVYIDVLDNEKQVEISLKNISKHEIHVDANELFERFVQGDQSRHSEGSGLGLAITKAFTDLQGGRCEIHVDGDLFKVILTFPKD